MDDKGNVWEEPNYEGYGDFGGKNYYDLMAEMNGLKDRSEGINAYLGWYDFKDVKGLKYPNLSESKDWKWINERPKNCESQGFFY